MYNLSIFFLIISLSFQLYGQNVSKVDSLIDFAGSINYSNPIRADSVYKLALVEANKLNYTRGVANSYKGLGVVADVRDKLEIALYNYELGYETFMSIGDTLDAYKCKYNAGMVYRKLEMYQQAKDIYVSTREVFDRYNFTMGSLMCETNIGACYYEQENISEALRIFNECNKTYEQLGIEDCNINGNIGNCHFRLEQHDSAIYYLNKSYSIAEKSNNLWGMTSFGPTLVMIYGKEGQYSKAIELAEEIKALAIQNEMSNDAIRLAGILSECYAEIGDFENAYYNIKQRFDISDSIRNAEFLMELKSKEEYIQNQKSKNEIAILKEQEKASQLKSERKDLINKTLSGGGIFVIIIAFMLFFQSKKRRQLNSTLQNKNEKIEEQHQEIIDSIAYAKRIQSAILPPDKLIKEALGESFILYEPKDVVAGDFYWVEKRDNTLIFAACDCTGHGVPGAMVSVICNNALNRAVREHNLKDPGKILDKARDIVIKEFEKSEEEVKDGMDISLCSIEGNNLRFAGAHNPIWIIRNNELIEIKGDKQPVGKFENATPFHTENFELKKDDTLYIFTDGYVDQFGGEKGKKFKSKNFKNLLLSSQSLSMNDQLKKIRNEFEEWKGSLEQVDDVCVIGVRV